MAKLQRHNFRLANPFVIGRYAGPQYFCDRARLSPMQRSPAIYLAKSGPISGILSAEALSASGFKTAASMQAACKGLEKAGLLAKTNEIYSLYYIFFATWLRKTM